MKLFRLALPAAKVGATSLIVAAVVFWLLATAAGYAGRVVGASEEAGWLALALLLANQVGRGLAGLLLAWACWSLAVRLAGMVGPWLLGLAEVEEVEISPPSQGPEEAPQIEGTMEGLRKALAGLEEDSGQAGALIADARQRAAVLARLVKSIAVKAEEMRLEAEALDVALAAIAGEDAIQIARAAGGVRDEQIQELMLASVSTGSYWAGVGRVVAAQLGTLSQWAAGYDRFAERLLGEVSTAKARLAALSASLELAGAARPLVEVRLMLDEAEGYLQLDSRPGLREAARTLPAVNGLRLRG